MVEEMSIVEEHYNDYGNNVSKLYILAAHNKGST